MRPRYCASHFAQPQAKQKSVVLAFGARGVGVGGRRSVWPPSHRSAIDNAARGKIMAFCTSCGSERPLQAKFCPICGAAFLDRPDAAEVKPAPTPVPMPMPSEEPTSRAAAGAAATATTDAAANAAPRGAPAMLAARNTVVRLASVRLSSEQVVDSAKAGAAALGASAGILVVVAALMSVVMGPEGHTGSPRDWFMAGVALLGLGMHAPLQADISAGTSLFGGAATASLTMTPLFVTGFLVLFSAWFARRAERTRPNSTLRELVACSTVAGATFAVCSTLLAFLMRGSVGYGVEGTTGLAALAVQNEVHLNGWLVFLGGFLTCLTGGLIGRAMAFAAHRKTHMTALVPTQLRTWAADGIFAARLMGGTFVAVFAGCLLLGLYELIAGTVSSSSSVGSNLGVSAPSGSGWLTAIEGIFVLLPNLLVFATGLAMGSSVSASVTGEGSALDHYIGGTQDFTRGLGLLTGDAPAMLYLLPVLVLAVALWVGFRSLLLRAPGQGSQVRPWRVSLLYAAAWLVLAELTQIQFELSASASALEESAGASGALAFGLGFFVIACCAVFWSLVATWGADRLGRPIATILPGMMLRLGGRAIHPEWQFLLVQAQGAYAKATPSASEHEGVTVDPDSLPAPLPVNPRRDRRILLVTGSVLVLGALGFVGFRVVNSVVYGPASTVEDYFGHVKDHDASGALALVQGVSGADFDQTLLSSKAMTGTPTDVSVSEVEVSGESATVVVSETFAGTSHASTLTLAKDGKVHGMFDHWVLQDPFTYLEVATSREGQSVTVNDVPVSAGVHPVFPGRYKVAAAKSGFWLASNTAVDASGGDGDQQTVNVGQTFDPRLQEAADQAVHKYLDNCVAQTEASPTGCFSMGLAVADDLKNVKRKVSEYPIVSVEPSETDDTASLSVETPGSVEYTATQTDWSGNVSSTTPETMTIYSIDGALTWDGGDPSTATIVQNSDAD